MARRNSVKNVCKVGKTRWHEMELVVTHSDIDNFFREFRVNVKMAVEWGDLIKEGPNMKAAPHAGVSGGIYLPTDPNCRVFTLQDITEAKRIFKNNKKKFVEFFVGNTKEVNSDQETINDWDDFDAFKRLLRRLRVTKPSLTAALIFGAWTHHNYNVHPTWGDTCNKRNKVKNSNNFGKGKKK
jgi:hypothetical protein